MLVALPGITPPLPGDTHPLMVSRHYRGVSQGGAVPRGVSRVFPVMLERMFTHIYTPWARNTPLRLVPRYYPGERVVFPGVGRGGGTIPGYGLL